ncbi:MAG: type I methionyl aminopeptidase [Pirellulales bacterium]
MIQFRSEREISEMRKAGLLIWQAHQLAAEMVRPGAVSGEIDVTIGEFFARHDAVSLFKNYPNSTKGKRPFPSICCFSFNEEVVHGIPGKRQLVEGDVLSIDMGCRLNGWCADAAVTHAVGQIAPDVRRLLEVTSGVLRLAIELMATKSWWSEVAPAMQSYVANAGFSSVEDFVGHGIGREMHEDPQVPNYYSAQLKSRKGNFPIRPGLVIAIEPMVNIGSKKVTMLGDDWTMITRDRKPSAHFEHTVAMTAGGPRVLTGAPSPEEPEWTSWGRERLRAPESFARHATW